MLSTNIAAEYADLARLYAERDVAERAIGVQSETAKLVQSRVANGLDTLAEQRQAEAEPLQAQADVARTGRADRARGNRNKARRAGRRRTGSRA